MLLRSTEDAGGEGEIITTEEGLRYQDLRVGTGDEAVKGKSISVNYTGWLDENGQKGKKFDSSLDRAQIFMFDLGLGQVIAGWDQGVKGMKEGGKRLLMIPAKLGYGARGVGDIIPPNADLIFEVDLIKVE